MSLTTQIFWLFVGAMPIACISWTVTNEEIFRDPREYCIRGSKFSNRMLMRKLFYLFTCEYCFSHYVALAFIIFTDYTILIDDWRGNVIALFSWVWVANIYMSLFALLRQSIKKERTEIKEIEEHIEK